MDATPSTLDYSKATITWDLSDDGGSEVISFELSCRDEFGSVVGPESYPGYETTTGDDGFGNLYPNTVYTCTIIAINSEGNSPESDPSPAFMTLNPPPCIPTINGEGSFAADLVDLDVEADIYSDGCPQEGELSFAIVNEGETCDDFPVVISSSTIPYPGGTLSAEIGLAEGVTYNAWAIATGSGGVTCSEAPLEFTTWAKPETPTDVDAYPSSDDFSKVTIVWTPPYDGGVEIDEYLVTCKSASGTLIGPESYPGYASDTDVDGFGNLMPNTAYTCTVVATNSLGNSPVSAPSPSFTTLNPAPCPPTINGDSSFLNSAVTLVVDADPNTAPCPQNENLSFKIVDEGGACTDTAIVTSSSTLPYPGGTLSANPGLAESTTYDAWGIATGPGGATCSDASWQFTTMGP